MALTRRLRRRRRKRILIAIFMAVYASLHRERNIWLKERSRLWWNEIALGTFDDMQWRENFRVSKASFRFLCRKLSGSLESLTVEHRVGVTLYFLASNAEYRTIGNLFGIHKSTVWSCVHEVCNAIIDILLPIFVKFPNEEQLKDVIKGFMDQWKFPNCAGAIDATHIPIIAPKEDHADYVNRKGWYSVIFQAVCDHIYRFIDLCIGWPGRVHDTRVFANSQLMAPAATGNLMPASAEWSRRVGIDGAQVDMPLVLIGDAASPMCSWLLKPYSGRGSLTLTEQAFNYRRSSARMTIENTFGRFKGRWRRFLKRIDLDVQFVPELVTAAATLHNICETSGEIFDHAWMEEANVVRPRQPDNCQLQAQPMEGKEIRQALSHLMNIDTILESMQT